MKQIKLPSVLDSKNLLESFDCGNDTLNEWLSKRALKNQDNGAIRTFVISNKQKVIGYYALTSGSIERLSAPKSLSRNMPEPIPVAILARLAIDVNYQGQQLGARLLRDAMKRILSVSQNIGIKAMMVHAISESAKEFYLSYGFKESTNNSMLLFYSVKDIIKHLNWK
ncbi:MAG: GNAT family N-acetyltransferase [Alcanivoracaceae bacterium]|nr:GNAT family N-acetyltransferase [Alcanivoracaceae bacterium]